MRVVLGDRQFSCVEILTVLSVVLTALFLILKAEGGSCERAWTRWHDGLPQGSWPVSRMLFASGTGWTAVATDWMHRSLGYRLRCK